MSKKEQKVMRSLERELTECQRKLAEAEVDAKRYQWLRECGGLILPPNELVPWDDTDARIDAAIKSDGSRDPEPR